MILLFFCFQSIPKQIDLSIKFGEIKCELGKK